MKNYFIILLIATLYSCQDKPQEKDSVIEEVITDHPAKEIKAPEEYCFLKVNGKDSIVLNFKKQGDSIWGNYNNLHYGIDQRHSTFKGTLKGKDAYAISKYSAEGQNYTEELTFIVEDDKARLNYGITSQDEDGIWRYKKGAPLQEHILPKVPCN